MKRGNCTEGVFKYLANYLVKTIVRYVRQCAPITAFTPAQSYRFATIRADRRK
jgi:hypothetical protein